jgi:Ca2+-binding EF-hand superfamily protein
MARVSLRQWCVSGLLLAAAGLLVAWEVLPPASFGMGDGPEFKKKKGKGDEFKMKKGKGEDETAKMLKLLEKSYKKGETERDKLLKELRKLWPEGRPLGDDHGDWFDVLADGGPQWRRAAITSMGLADLFDRVAGRLEIDAEKISRNQFIEYARRFLREDSSPLWKAPKDADPAAEAEKLFQRLDNDGDGRLTESEAPPALQADFQRWDRSADGVINLEEYRAYFGSRLWQLDREVRDQMVKPALPEPLEETERPKVIRAGKLPPGLPDWFTPMDYDRDGQIALYEWRRCRWPLEEFPRLDLNDDGLLVPEELLRQLAVVHRDGTRPFSYLMERRLDHKAGAPAKKKGGKKG